MTGEPTPTATLRLGLLENACHSLKRGFQQWQLGKAQRDAWLLKEAFVWVHHGIELTLKQLLVQTNQFLVFENVDKAVEELGKLRKKPGMSEAAVLDLFDSDQRIQSVGFRKLVRRVNLMLNIDELAPAQPLRIYIDDLAQYRNKITHFSVEIDVDRAEILLGDLMAPLLDVLDAHLLDDEFRAECIPEIRSLAQPVRVHVHELYAAAEARVLALLRKLSGTEVDGRLLGSSGTIEVPAFSRFDSPRPGQRGPDIRADSETAIWVVEIVLRSSHLKIRGDLQKLEMYKQEVINQDNEILCWLVSLDEASDQVRALAAESGVLFSSAREIAQLESL